MKTLTPRQTQVIKLIVAGRSNRAIAAELGVTYRTVEGYVRDLIQIAGPRPGSHVRVYLVIWYLKECGALRPLQIGDVDRVVRVWEMPHPLESPAMAAGLMQMMEAA